MRPTQPLQIEAIVLLGEEIGLAVIAALDKMQWNARQGRLMGVPYLFAVIQRPTLAIRTNRILGFRYCSTDIN